MKPLNLDNSPCAPQSSNCVIWQGPDIPCIKICNGDSVSEVVYKLANELCNILDELKISTYDLSCLNLGNSTPTTFPELIQMLISKICELENIPTTSPNTGTGGCPDCVVTVAACFQVGGQTTMQLLDYVNAIATRVCGLVSQITSINTQITSLNTRVTALENAPAPSVIIPSIISNCTLASTADPGSNVPSAIISGNSYNIDKILAALINDSDRGYCQLLGATGLPTQLADAIAEQCVLSSTPSLVNPANTMSTQYTGHWINSSTTVAGTITNLWSSICDVRTAYGTFNTLVSTIITDLGDSTAITNATAAQCVHNADLSLVTGNPMTSIVGWKVSPANFMESVINLWLSLCDTRTAVSTLKTNVTTLQSDLTALETTVADLPTAETVISAGSGITVTGPVLTPGTPDLKTYTVSLSPTSPLGGMYVSGAPTTLVNVSATASTDILTSGIVQLPGTVDYDDINGATPTYNTGTGIWTCPTTGRYNINFTVHLSNAPGGTPTGFTSGSFVAGLTGATTTYYALNTIGITQVHKYINITGSAVGLALNAGDTITLRILNLSNVSYSPAVGDKVTMSIERIK